MELGILLLVVLCAVALCGFAPEMDRTQYISFLERDAQGRAVKDAVTGHYKITRIVSGQNPRTPKPFYWLDNQG